MSKLKDRLIREALAGGASGARTTRTHCPLCARSGHSTKKKNLSFDRATGKWFCWRCERIGTLENWKVDEDALASRVLPDLQTFDPPPGWVPIGEVGTPLTYTARNYGIGRGIAASTLVSASMGVSTEKGEEKDAQDFRGRLIVPILARDQGTWLGYVGRDLRKKSSLPYLYVRGMSRGRLLYNQRALDVRTDEPVVVVEGTLDTAYLWPNSVAVLGTWGPDQFDLLLEAKRPIVVALDGDAWRKGEALAMCLKLYEKRAGWVRLPPKLDVDDVPRSWLDEEVRRSLK